MYSFSFLFLLIFLLTIACNQISNENNEKKENIIEQTEQFDEYYGFDTLLLEEYVSESGNIIRLLGSKSNDLYQISVINTKGITKKFQIADNHYIASHSYIEWYNEHFIFVRFGCGTGCWAAKILSIDDNESKDYYNFIYEDQINNLIIYPDTVNSEFVVIENFQTNKSMKIDLNLCKEYILPIMAIDTVQKINEDKLLFEFSNKSCQQIEKKVITIREIIH